VIVTRAPSLLRPQIGEPEMLAWFLAASPGDRIAYWRGHLAIELAPTASPLSQSERRRLRGVKVLALSMAETGLVHLVQQRLGPGFIVGQRKPFFLRVMHKLTLRQGFAQVEM
jgi:hypothetical protein